MDAAKWILRLRFLCGFAQSDTRRMTDGLIASFSSPVSGRRLKKALSKWKWNEMILSVFRHPLSAIWFWPLIAKKRQPRRRKMSLHGGQNRAGK